MPNLPFSRPDRAFMVAILPYAAMLGGMLSMVVGTSLAKQLFPVIGATGVSAYRTGFAALVLLALWRPWRVAWTREALSAVLRYGVVLGLMNLCFYLSLRTIPLGVALAIEFLGPLAVSLANARRLLHFLWIGLAVSGLVLLLPLQEGSARLDPEGVGFALAAAVCWALYIVFGRSAARVHPGRAVALGMATAAVVVAPVGIAEAGADLLAPGLLLFGFVIAILSSALPFSLEMLALRHIPQRSFGVLTSAEPVVGALAGVVFLGESLTGLQWLAIACIVTAAAGMVIATTRHRPGGGKRRDGA